MDFPFPLDKNAKFIEVFLHLLGRFSVGFLDCCTARSFLKWQSLYLKTLNSIDDWYGTRHLFPAPCETSQECNAKNDPPVVHFPSSNPLKCQPNLLPQLSLLVQSKLSASVFSIVRHHPSLFVFICGVGVGGLSFPYNIFIRLIDALVLWLRSRGLCLGLGLRLKE